MARVLRTENWTGEDWQEKEHQRCGGRGSQAFCRAAITASMSGNYPRPRRARQWESSVCLAQWQDRSTENQYGSVRREPNWPDIYRTLYPMTGEGNGTPLQHSCLENPMDGGAWWAAVHGVAKSRTRLSDFTFTFHFHALEKEMATHSSVLAWRIPGMGEPGGLPSMGSHRVRYNWSDLAAAYPMTAQYTFFATVLETLTMTDHILGHKTNFKKLRSIQII